MKTKIVFDLSGSLSYQSLRSQESTVFFLVSSKPQQIGKRNRIYRKYPKTQAYANYVDSDLTLQNATTDKALRYLPPFRQAFDTLIDTQKN